MATNGMVGALFATLGLDTAQFQQGIDGAKSDMKGFGTAMAGIGKTVAMAGVAALATGGAAFVKFGFEALTAADNIGDAAARIGITGVEFQKLEAAATAAGGAPGLMTEAMDKLNVGLGAFIQTGGGPASQAFKDLGLSSKIASGEIKTADQAFYAASAALEGITSPAEKARLSMQLFGKGAGADMVEVLAPGAVALRGYGDAAQKSGRIMSEEMIAKLPQMKLKLDETRLALSQMAMVAAGEALLSMEGFAKANAPLIAQGKAMATQFGQVATKVVDYLAPSFKELFSAVGSLMSGPFGQHLLWTVTAIGKVVGGALVLGLKLAVDAFARLARGIDALFTIMDPLLSKFRELGTNLVDGLVNGIKGGYERVRASVAELATKIKSAFTNPMQIQSPSRVFIGFGENIAEGLAIGIRKGGAGAVEAMKALGDQVQGLFAKYASEQEVATNTFVSEIGTADLALKNGKISAQEYAVLIERIQAAYGNIIAFKLPELPPLATPTGIPELASTDWIDKAKDGLGQAANDNSAMRDGFKSMFSEGIKAAMDGDLAGFLKSKLQSFASRMFDGAIDTLGGALFDMFKGMGGGGQAGGGGGFMSTIFKAGMSIFGKSLPGYANGVSGTFTGGRGGRDANVFSARVTRGESISITPKNDNGGGGRMVPVTINMDTGIKQFVIDTSRGTAFKVAGGMMGSAATSQQRARAFGR